MFVRYLITVLFALFLINQPILALDCEELFSYAQNTHPSFFTQDSNYVELSKIPSSFNRFKRGRADIKDPNSFIEIDNFESSSVVPYPVIKVDISVLSEDGSIQLSKASALINSPTTMILVLDSSIDKKSIESVSYQETSLKVTKIKTLKDKTLYELSSPKSLSVDDNYASFQKNNKTAKTLQEFLSLYNIPQNEGQMFEFLYPPIQSVVNVDAIDEDSEDDWMLSYQEIYDLIRSIKFLDGPSRNTIFDEDSKDRNGLYTSIATSLYFHLTDHYRNNRAIKFFNNYDLTYEEYQDLLEKAHNLFFPGSTNTFPEIMDIFSSIIYSYNLEKLYDDTSIPKEIRTNGSFKDMSYNFEDYVEGFDQEFDQLVDLLFNQNQIQKLASSRYSLNLHLDVTGVRQEIKNLLKKIVWLVGREAQARKFSRSVNSFSLFGSNLLRGLYKKTKGSCTATIVSSNTIITAAHCLDKSNELVVQIGTKKIGSIAYYKAPTYESTDVMDYDHSDMAIVRFPDGSFNNMMHAKISFSDKKKNLICTTTQGRSNKRKIILIEPPKVYIPGFNGYKSFQALKPGDSGSPLFGSDGSIIGVATNTNMDTGETSVTMFRKNKKFIEWVVSVDPKVKIRGVNID